MAQNIITEIVSDFSGKPGETVPFTFNGAEMTVDLDNLERHNFERMIAAHQEKIANLEAEFAAKMAKEGIFVTGFYYPVVPKGQARIRVQVSAGHTTEQLDRCIAAFVKIGKEMNVIK